MVKKSSFALGDVYVYEDQGRYSKIKLVLREQGVKFQFVYDEEPGIAYIIDTAKTGIEGWYVGMIRQVGGKWRQTCSVKVFKAPMFQNSVLLQITYYNTKKKPSPEDAGDYAWVIEAVKA
jgi:hypothetical protein